MYRTEAEILADIAETREAMSRAKVAIEQRGAGSRLVVRANLTELRKELTALYAELREVNNSGRNHFVKAGCVRGGW